MSRQLEAPNEAWSKRGIRVGSCVCHHVSIDATSSARAAASAEKLSAPSEGTATTAWICWAVTMSGRSVALSPLPHHPAANAPGASHSAARTEPRTTSLRTRRTPEVEAALGARPQPAEIRAVQDEDRARGGDAEEHHGERVAVDDCEDRQRDARDDRGDRRIAHEEEDDEPYHPGRQRNPDGDAEEDSATG